MTIIAVDFDGTLVDNRYPRIGPDAPEAFEWLRKFQDAGAGLILWTMRDGDTLTEAVEHCRERGIEFWGVNSNPDQAETRWSTSPKAFAHLYIDDAAACIPLKTCEGFRRPVVDWSEVGPAVMRMVHP